MINQRMSKNSRAKLVFVLAVTMLFSFTLFGQSIQADSGWVNPASKKQLNKPTTGTDSGDPWNDNGNGPNNKPDRPAEGPGFVEILLLLIS